MAGSDERPRTPSIMAAVAFAVVAFALYTGQDTTVKLLSGRYDTFQIAFLNALFALGPMSVLVMKGGLGQLRTRLPWLHALRGLCSIISVPLTFYAFSRMAIADAYALLFSTPLLITALSVPLLRETVGWRRWSAVLVGFVGVLLMLRPGAGVLQAASLAALGGAFASALGIIILRRLQSTESSVSFGVYGNFSVMLGAVLVLPFVFKMPALPDLGLSVLGGSLGGIAFLFLIAAYRRAPVAVIAPFQYSQMPYGLLVGFVIFGHVPDRSLFVGGAIVIGSGLYILRRETLLRRGVASGTIVRAPMWRRWGRHHGPRTRPR
jgi:drug/metabolite transporter (DMT)-like permease